MERCKRNKKTGAREEMHEDTSPGQMSQQDGESEVNATGLEGFTVPHEHFAFGLRMTVDGVATTHSSHSVSSNSVSPYDSQTWHCLHIQGTLREGQGANPPPEYTLMGSIITDMHNENENLTKAVALVQGQVILFFGRQSQGEGLSYEEV